MRRIAAVVLVPLIAVAALAGCGSSAPAKSAAAANTNAAVKVTGAFGSSPTVTIPAKAPSTQLAISTPVKGTGPALASGNSALAQVVLYKWSGTTHTLLDSTYTAGPEMIPATIGLSGLATALKGATMGTRIVAVLPPKYGYGTSGNSEIGVTGTDTLVWVIDLLQQFTPTDAAKGPVVSHGGGTLPKVTAPAAGKAPVITVPKSAAPGKLSVTTLVKGSGPKLATGDTVVAQYVGSIWRTGKVFQSTWPSASAPTGEPFSFQLGGQVLVGWNDGLKGVTVGSRVMLVIPPKLGYGKAGQASAGIKKNDTLVFVIDILGVQAAPAG